MCVSNRTREYTLQDGIPCVLVLSFSWSLGWSACWLACWSACWSSGWSEGCSAGCLAGWSAVEETISSIMCSDWCSHIVAHSPGGPSHSSKRRGDVSCFSAWVAGIGSSIPVARIFRVPDSLPHHRKVVFLKQRDEYEKRPSLLKKGVKARQIASASKNPSKSEGLIKGQAHPLRSFSTGRNLFETLQYCLKTPGKATVV